MKGKHTGCGETPFIAPGHWYQQQMCWVGTLQAGCGDPQSRVQSFLRETLDVARMSPNFCGL